MCLSEQSRSSNTANSADKHMTDMSDFDLPMVIPEETRRLEVSQCIYPKEYEGHFDRLLIPKDEIAQVVQALAKQLCNDYHGTRPVLVCVLKGASPFFQHLCDYLMQKKQGFDTEFIRVSSYEGTSSTGNVQVAGGLNLQHVQNRHILLVEDIIDTGTTLSHLIPHLQEQASPKSIQVATLLKKRLPEPAKCEAKYVGFTIPNHFIIGYGLDYNELYRDTQDIFIISKEGIDFDATTLN
ncbi:phosphoribosyltransferase-like protein [Nitzschia inconspicua]|uniref:Hypoxanthine phosphoribosyltransferase n=1 Tax=Nitzschia inconspicua TaxID=303405 RepID=A0A9K3KK73_9STRA|nr:phosphoribosyltransferase-like protein [Nitzschia inconspicua]